MENKEDYYTGLSGITQRGHCKSWILYILKAVEVTSNIAYERLMILLQPGMLF